MAVDQDRRPELLMHLTDETAQRAVIGLVERFDPPQSMIDGQAIAINILRISDDTRTKVTPLWSPDGKYIYYSALLDGDWPVYRNAADGTGNEELVFRYTPGAFVGLSDISPSGKFLVCESGGVILLVPLTVSDPVTRQPVDYVRDEFQNGTGRLSPYGRFIAYRSDEAKPERFEIYVRPFDPDKPASADQKMRLASLSPDDVQASVLAGDAITARLTSAPGNGAAIGGLKVVTDHGWFAARPSGTEAVYKLYAESFRGPDHLRAIQEEAQAIIGRALAGVLR